MGFFEQYPIVFFAAMLVSGIAGGWVGSWLREQRQALRDMRNLRNG